MNECRKLSEELMTSLELKLPPIAIAFCDAAPPNVSTFGSTAPAGCAFWQHAAKRTFTTTAKDHELCSIGVHTHHLAGASPAQAGELQEALQAMIGLDYVRADEVGSIPVLEREVKHAVYGPLSEFPIPPQIVLLFAHARQGLILSEAVSRVDGDAPLALGRPACAVVPQVMSHGRAAMSLGCCGARAYLDALSDDVALWAFPAEKLAEYTREIGVLARANATLSVFHRRRRQDVQSGMRPSVRESLERCIS